MSWPSGIVSSYGIAAFALVAVVLCAASWLAGRLLHETAHAVACFATGARIERWTHSYVDYVAPDERADALIRAAPVLAFLVLVVLVGVQLVVAGPNLAHVFTAVFLLAFAPWSPEDRSGLREWLAMLADG